MKHHPLIMNLPIIIRQERLLRNWPQDELADRAGISRTQVGKIERGDAIPSLETLLKLELAFNLPAGSLLKTVSSPVPKASVSAPVQSPADLCHLLEELSLTEEESLLVSRAALLAADFLRKDRHA